MHSGSYITHLPCHINQCRCQNWLHFLSSYSTTSFSTNLKHFQYFLPSLHFFFLTIYFPHFKEVSGTNKWAFNNNNCLELLSFPTFTFILKDERVFSPQLPPINHLIQHKEQTWAVFLFPNFQGKGSIDISSLTPLQPFWDIPSVTHILWLI